MGCWQAGQRGGREREREGEGKERAMERRKMRGVKRREDTTEQMVSGSTVYIEWLW